MIGGRNESSDRAEILRSLARGTDMATGMWARVAREENGEMKGDGRETGKNGGLTL